MLVFYAEWAEPSDQLVRSRRASDTLAALRAGRLDEVKRRYPDAQVGRIVKEACEKALTGHSVLLPSE
jgi:hypothetical protein